MFTLSVNRPKLQTAVIKYFLHEDFNFEQFNVLAGTTTASPPSAAANFLDVGTVVGQKSLGAVTVSAAVAASGNTGNGTVALGSPAYGAAAVVGSYSLVAISATEWEVYSPLGDLQGVAKNGTAFSGAIVFTITAGGTAFVAGDSFTIAVAIAAGGGQIVPLNTSAVDGSQNVAGIISRGVTVSASVDTPAAVLTRGPAVVLADQLIWPSGISAGAQAAAIAQLATMGIIVRNS